MSTDSINMSTAKTTECSQQIFEMAGGCTFLRIDLDVIVSNLRILKSKCSPHTDNGGDKANAYGHGATMLAHHLSRHGISHFAVASVSEGRQLRKAGVVGLIQVFGNSVVENVEAMRQYQLTPTATTDTFLREWARCAGTGQKNDVPPVSIKIDTGMSRNGCQPEELPTLMKTKWHQDTCRQLSSHITGVATDLDFVRPGICLYGLSPDSSPETVQEVQSMGLRPALCWIARPSLVKRLAPGRSVGYDQTYKVEQEETIATVPVGYADGYNRHLSSKGIVLTALGQQQRVVGRVSMDAISLVVNPETTTTTPLYVYSDQATSANSVARVAQTLGTIPYEVVCLLSDRLPRIYRQGNQYLPEYTAIGLEDPNGYN